jgi:hypothetical protein
MPLETLIIRAAPAMEMLKAMSESENADRWCFLLTACVSLCILGLLQLKNWLAGTPKVQTPDATDEDTLTPTSSPQPSPVYEAEMEETTSRVGQVLTPTPGPAFGHGFKQSTVSHRKPTYPPSTMGDDHRTGRPSAPGYQTPFIKGPAFAHGSSDYSNLKHDAPTAFRELVHRGLLNEDGSPTRKTLDSERKKRRMSEIKVGEAKVERRLFT